MFPFNLFLLCFGYSDKRPRPSKHAPQQADVHYSARPPLQTPKEQPAKKQTEPIPIPQASHGCFSSNQFHRYEHYLQVLPCISENDCNISEDNAKIHENSFASSSSADSNKFGKSSFSGSDSFMSSNSSFRTEYDPEYDLDTNSDNLCQEELRQIWNSS
jgi:hypothetical protein